MNIFIDNVSMEETLEKIAYLVENEKQSYVVTPNVDHMVKLQNDDEFQEIYDNASIIIADGVPIIWISKLFKRPIKEKVSGSDLFPRVCEMAAKKGYSMFFFGAAEGVAEIAAKNLTAKYSGLNVVGTYSPKRGFENDAQEVNKSVELINKCSPDILVVALGAPKQEKFFYRNKDELDVKIAIMAGACLDFEADVLKRAPAWMSRVGLEWFYRLCKEPKRLYKRYLVESMAIFKMIWKYRKPKTQKMPNDEQ